LSTPASGVLPQLAQLNPEHGAARRVAAAAAELCALLPGVGVLVLRRAGEEVVVEGSAGVPETVRGTVLAQLRRWPRPRDSDRAQELSCSTEPIHRLVGGRRRWRAVGLATADGIFDAFRTLATEFALLLTGLDRPDHADEVADRLRWVTVTVGASIGLAGRRPS
jgi:hypothetical protein